jgi:hypothetical protein
LGESGRCNEQADTGNDNGFVHWRFHRWLQDSGPRAVRRGRCTTNALRRAEFRLSLRGLHQRGCQIMSAKIAITPANAGHPSDAEQEQVLIGQPLAASSARLRMRICMNTTGSQHSPTKT